MTATTITPAVTASHVLTTTRRVGFLIEFADDQSGTLERGLIIHALEKSDYDSHHTIARQAFAATDPTNPAITLNRSAMQVVRSLYADYTEIAQQIDLLLAQDQKQVLAELKDQEPTSTDIWGETVRVGDEVAYGAAAGKLTTGKILEIVPATGDVPEYFVVDGAGVTPVMGVIRIPRKKQQARDGSRRY